MHELSKRMLLVLAILALLTAAEIMALSMRQYPEQRLARDQVIDLIGLPDLYLGYGSTWLRHPGLATLSTVISEDGTLLDYYRGSFVISLESMVR
jgi:hypothetical protein